MAYIQRAISNILKHRVKTSKCTLVVGICVKIGLNQEKPYK